MILHATVPVTRAASSPAVLPRASLKSRTTLTPKPPPKLPSHQRHARPSLHAEKRLPLLAIQAAKSESTLPQASPVALKIPASLTSVTERRKINEAMVADLFPVLLQLYGTNPNWAAKYDQAFNRALNQKLFPDGPVVKIDVVVDFNNRPHLQGTFLKADLKAIPEPKSQPVQAFLSRLWGLHQPAPAFDLGQCRIAAGSPPTTPEAQEQLKGLLKRQIHDVLLMLANLHLKANPRPSVTRFERIVHP